MSISGIGGGAQMVRSFQPPSFSSIDSDSSGAISLDELKSGAPAGADSAKSAERAETLFAAMDTDSDGAITSDEKDSFDAKLQEQLQTMQFMTQLMAGGAQPPSNESIFAATDKDGSGSVDLAEFSDSDAAEELSSDAISELFATIDGDGDGAITEAESNAFLDGLKTALAESGQTGGGPGGMGGPPPGGPPPGGPPPSGETSEEDEEEDSIALDLLSAANTAYSTSSQQSDDLLAALTKIFDQAA